MGEFLPQSVIEDSLLSCVEETGEPGRRKGQATAPSVTVASIGCQTVREWQGNMIRERLDTALERGAGRIALSMGGVTGVSSAFIRELIQVSDRCRVKGGRMVLFGVDPAIGALFRAAGFDAKLEITDTREDAVELARLDPSNDREATARGKKTGLLGKLMGKRAA